jgi:formylglycine-generating enzyme
MRRILNSLALLCAISLVHCPAAWTDVFNMPAGQTSLLTVPVGNPGNANDPYTGTIYGSVSYSYSIGTYDVTVGQYTAFLNAVAATDTYSLYNPSMATDQNVAGIAQNGTSGSYTYSVIGSANHPITYVSLFDAARFSNWLFNGQPTTGGEGSGTTETGSYTLNGSNPTNVSRNTNATWVIPTENEWYKAAYFNPGTSSYYQYPFSSSTAPTSAMPGSTPNTGNFINGSYAVTGSSGYSSTQNYLTDVRAYTASASPYGAFDMGGDVFQWNETLISSGSLRGLRGGSWDISTSFLSSPGRSGNNLSSEFNDIGFRVAVVPEPSTIVLASIACGLMWTLRKRRK